MNKDNHSKAGSTITINGKHYDAVTGRPVDAATKRELPKTRQYGGFDIRPATGVHAGPSRSQTLRRTGLSKPVSVAHQTVSRHVRTVSPGQTHPLVSKFGRPAETHVVTPSEVLSSINRESAAAPVGFATQVQNYTPSATINKPVHKPVSRKAAVQKHQLDTAPTKAERRASATKKSDSNWKKFQNRIKPNPPLIITAAVIAVLIASVICYLTIPALSLFVAAKSAGVEATYPNYVPAGYHFDGPVTYRDGEVSMKFAGNGSAAQFTIVQKTSPWDSGAVLDNYVLGRSSTYLTYSQSGITVYTFGSSAAWMNAGVLHTIDGNAPLTSDQILRIAGSM